MNVMKVVVIHNGGTKEKTIKKMWEDVDADFMGQSKLTKKKGLLYVVVTKP